MCNGFLNYFKAVAHLAYLAYLFLKYTGEDDTLYPTYICIRVGEKVCKVCKVCNGVEIAGEIVAHLTKKGVQQVCNGPIRKVLQGTAK